MNNNFTPMYDRIAVEPLAHEEKTVGGIFIPETAKEKPVKGRVVSVGKGYRGEDGRILPLDVKVGDTVLYGKWAGTEVKIDDKEVVIMKESDVFCIIK